MKKLLFAAMLLLSAQSFAQNVQLVNPVSKIYTTNEFGRDSASVTILHGKTVKMPDLKGTAGQVLTKNIDGSIGLSTPAAGGGLTKAQVDSAARKNIADSLRKVFSSASIPYDHTYFDTLSTGALTIKPGAFSSSGGASSFPTVTTSNITPTTLTATWNSTGAAAYQLVQATSADMLNNRLVYNPVMGTIFNVTGLNPASNYFFGVVPIYATAVTTTAVQSNYTTIYYADFSTTPTFPQDAAHTTVGNIDWLGARGDFASSASNLTLTAVVPYATFVGTLKNGGFDGSSVYRITLTGVTPANLANMNGQSSSDAYDFTSPDSWGTPTLTGSTVVYTFTSTQAVSQFWFQINGNTTGLSSFVTFKIEKHN